MCRTFDKSMILIDNKEVTLREKSKDIKLADWVKELFSINPEERLFNRKDKKYIDFHSITFENNGVTAPTRDFCLGNHLLGPQYLLNAGYSKNL